MTNDLNAPLCDIRKPRADVRATAKYILSFGSCRSLLTFGGLLAAVSLALPYLIALLVLSFMPQAYLYDNTSNYVASLVLLAITVTGIPFTFSPVYFGLYRVLLRASECGEATKEDLFFAFKDGKTYLRSVGVFFHSFGIIYGMYLLIGFTQIIALCASFVQNEYIVALLWILAESLILIYILFGIIYTAIMRKRISLLVPLLIHRTDLSFLTCKRIVYASKREVYVSWLRGDLVKCFFWNLLSLFTVGILQIIYVGPDMMSKKVALYKESILWLDDNS